MPWRVIEHEGRSWQVSMAAERRASVAAWSLVFSFRPAGVTGQTIWVTHEFSSPSKGALFAYAERISDDTLASILGAQLA
ncbi:MAG: hypothetical protein H0W67_07800 [Gemmatimonadales bacterium]|nr:hypothetical protein [Gemmatimonadales bacterium]